MKLFRMDHNRPIVVVSALVVVVEVITHSADSAEVMTQ
jgi:hypothetical protein